MPGTRFGRVRVWHVTQKDQLLISGDEVNGAPTVLGSRRLLPFSGNALFVGIRSPVTRPIGPVVGIDAFRRTTLSTHASRGSHERRLFLRRTTRFDIMWRRSETDNPC